jgi:putative peptidoglycan lipid II flippase
MVRRILNVLQKEVRGLHEAAYLLAVFGLTSQILALFRDRLLTSSFGAGETLDIYYAAFKIPDFIFVTVASMVSLSVLIPFLVERTADSKEEGKHFIGGIFSFFAISMIAVGAIAYILTPTLLKVLFPGFAGESFNELVVVTRILLFQPILLGASSLFASVVHVYRKFILYAVSPLLYNIGIIIGIIFFYDLFGIAGLAYGVILGALMHLSLQLPFIVKAGYLPKLELRGHFRDVKKIIILSLPRTLALSSNQIALLVLVGMASAMSSGSISVFNLSLNLQSVPLVIIGASYSVAAFPTLARLYNKGNREEFFNQITVAARHIIFWSFPAIALFVVLRAQIVRVILGAGEFTWTDTRLTAAALALFAISLVAQSLVLLFVRGYYAAGRTTKPVLINVFSSVLVIVFAFIFNHIFATSELWRYFIESLLRVEDIAGTSVLMLPFSYSLAVLINAVLFWIAFQKDFKRFSKTLEVTFFQSLAAAIVLGFVARQMLEFLDDFLDINTFMGIFGQGLLSGIVGILASIGTLKVLKSKELKEASRSLHNKFWKTTVISSE